ncbi:MAG: nitroreductase family protein [Dysgonamonadaceae bacterium]|jgi:nitroreductase|nr:nitroreductase family protein [Dysgonamonadaceae bacterium]
MSNFLELVQSRQSDRAFDASRPVEQEKLMRIIEAGRLAPSACNAQPWHFIVVDDPELKNKVADATATKILGLNHFTRQAPVHIVIVEEKVNFSSGFGTMVKDKYFAHVDIGIVAAHMTLAAADEGLGSCILGWFDEPKMRGLLKIPSNRRVLLDIVIGYSTQSLREKKRKKQDDIVSHNKYK